MTIDEDTQDNNAVAPEAIPQEFNDNQALSWQRWGLWPRNHRGQYMSLKVGRNDACSCGSGRKLKKCHGA